MYRFSFQIATYQQGNAPSEQNDSHIMIDYLKTGVGGRTHPSKYTFPSYSFLKEIFYYDFIF